MSDWCDSDGDDLDMMNRDRRRQNDQISKTVYLDALETAKTESNYQKGFDAAFSAHATFSAKIGEIKGKLTAKLVYFDIVGNSATDIYNQLAELDRIKEESEKRIESFEKIGIIDEELLERLDKVTS